MIYIYAFVVIFNSTLRIEIPYPTMQDCYMTHVMVENDPSRLYYNREDIQTIEFGCVKRSIVSKTLQIMEEKNAMIIGRIKEDK